MLEPAFQPQRDEERIVELLDALHALSEGPSPGRKAIEDELFAIVDRHLRAALKPWLLSKFGAAAGEGGAARFTAMMNDFFLKVLTQRHDAFWRAKSAKELRTWASVVISNQMSDHLRRERRYLDVADALAPLVEERRGFFKLKTGKDFTTEALDLINTWCTSGDDQEQFQGWTLRHRFVDGMTRDQIANQLSKSVHTVRQGLEAGIGALRMTLAD